MLKGSHHGNVHSLNAERRPVLSLDKSTAGSKHSGQVCLCRNTLFSSSDQKDRGKKKEQWSLPAWDLVHQLSASTLRFLWLSCEPRRREDLDGPGDRCVSAPARIATLGGSIVSAGMQSPGWSNVVFIHGSSATSKPAHELNNQLGAAEKSRPSPRPGNQLPCCGEATVQMKQEPMHTFTRFSPQNWPEAFRSTKNRLFCCISPFQLRPRAWQCWRTRRFSLCWQG